MKIYKIDKTRSSQVCKLIFKALICYIKLSNALIYKIYTYE